MGNGTCAIIATTYDGYYSESCMVTVNIQSDNGQITSPSTGGEGVYGRMILVVVFMVAALAGAAAVYSRKKRMVR